MTIPKKAYQISPIKLLSKISFHLEKNRKKQVTLVVILSFLSSLAESVSIALLIPFLSFFINPESYTFNKLYIFIFDIFNIDENKEILTTTTLFFILISMFITYTIRQFLDLDERIEIIKVFK